MENDTQRLKEFKELKESVRTNHNYLIVGVDAAKLSHHARFMLGSGRIVSKDFTFDNTLKGFEEFLGRIEMFKEKTDSLKVVCGLESTGNYERPLADFLCRNNFHVVMVSTLAVSKNRVMMDLSWDKNDPKDAINVADLVAQGKFLFYPFWEEQYQEAKRLIRLYHRIIKERARQKIRLRNTILNILFPEFERIFKRDISDRLALTILLKYPHPALIRSVTEEEFISSVLINRHKPLTKKRAYEVYKAAKETVGPRRAIYALSAELKDIIQDLITLIHKADEIKILIYEKLKDFEPYNRLISIPSVGPMVAATFLAEIGPIECYDHPRQIIKLAGLDLAGIQSGSYKGDKHISKRGKVRLRAAAYQAALTAMRHEGPLREYYLRLLEKKTGDPGAKMKALIALSCKILRIAFAVMKKNEDYVANYKG